MTRWSYALHIVGLSTCVGIALALMGAPLWMIVLGAFLWGAMVASFLPWSP